METQPLVAGSLPKEGLLLATLYATYCQGPSCLYGTHGFAWPTVGREDTQLRLRKSLVSASSMGQAQENMGQSIISLLFEECLSAIL